MKRGRAPSSSHSDTRLLGLCVDGDNVYKHHTHTFTYAHMYTHGRPRGEIPPNHGTSAAFPVAQWSGYGSFALSYFHKVRG